MTLTTKTHDFEVQNEFTIFLLRPVTTAAQDWLDTHTNSETSLYFGDSLCVEHRFIADIVASITADGLKVRPA